MSRQTVHSVIKFLVATVVIGLVGFLLFLTIKEVTIAKEINKCIDAVVMTVQTPEEYIELKNKCTTLIHNQQ